jgi:serine/threonine protein phosphatase 1
MTRPSVTFAMQTFGLNERGRDLVVGDIHGAFGALQRELDRVAFDGAVDRLFCVGDLVDRGPLSDQVLWWLDKPGFHSIMGNHEWMAFLNVYGGAFERRFHEKAGGEWLAELSRAEQEATARRLVTLPLVIEVQTASGPVGLIHADCYSDDWAAIRATDFSRLTDDNDDPFVRCCLWSTERYKRQYRRVVDNVRAVFHGHLTVRQSMVLGNAFFIDTGGWMPGGHFTLMDLSTLMPALAPGEAPPSGMRVMPVPSSSPSLVP